MSKETKKQLSGYGPQSSGLLRIRPTVQKLSGRGSTSRVSPHKVELTDGGDRTPSLDPFLRKVLAGITNYDLAKAPHIRPRNNGRLREILSAVLVPLLLWIGFTMEEENKRWLRILKAAAHIYDVLQSVGSRMDDDIMFLKYHLDCLLHKAVRSITPPPPLKEKFANFPCLFIGLFNLVIKRSFSLKDRRLAITLAASLQKGVKPALPQLSEESADQARRDLRLELEGDRGSLDGATRIHLQQLSREVFSPRKEDSYSSFLPNGRAVYERSLAKNGSLYFCTPPNVVDLHLPKQVNCLLEKHFPGPLVVLILDYWISDFGLSAALSSWQQSNFRDFQERTFEDMYTTDDHGQPLANRTKAILVSDPAKYRGLTIGSVNLKNTLLPIQKFLLAKWKNHRASTMRDEDLTERFNRIHSRVKENIPEFDYFCSGDYKSATNLLFRDVPVAICSALVDLLPGIVFALRSFLSGTCEMEMSDGELVSFILSEGQLMGHVLSFPFLCLVNLSCYYQTVDDYLERRFPDGNEPANLRNLLYDSVVINGDDIGFMCDQLFYDLWSVNIQKVGFQKSVGKNYLSTSFWLMNSQFFVLRKGALERVFYVNQNLSHSDPEKEDLATPISICSELNKICLQQSWVRPWIPMVLGKRFKRPLYRLGRVTFTPNWFLPVHLGGYGLDISLASNFRTTSLQRRVAAMFLRDPRLALYRIKSDVPLVLAPECLSGKWSLLPDPSLILNDLFRSPGTNHRLISGICRAYLGDDFISLQVIEPSEWDTLYSVYGLALQSGKERAAEMKMFQQKMVFSGDIKPISEENLKFYWQPYYRFDKSLVQCPEPLEPIQYFDVGCFSEELLSFAEAVDSKERDLLYWLSYRNSREPCLNSILDRFPPLLGDDALTQRMETYGEEGFRPSDFQEADDFVRSSQFPWLWDSEDEEF